MTKFLFSTAFLFAGAGVVLGAFGAHALKERVTPEMLAVFETAVRYQMYHALSLFGLALLSLQSNTVVSTQAIKLSGLGFSFGILIFSGSLYLLVATGVRTFGMMTPIGGLLFILSWGILFYSAFRLRKI